MQEEEAVDDPPERTHISNRSQYLNKDQLRKPSIEEGSSFLLLSASASAWARIEGLLLVTSRLPCMACPMIWSISHAK